MREASRKLREPLIFALFFAGAVAFTYPLVENLETAVTDHVDPLLDAWTLAWVAHQLPRDPAHLYDANRFYPERGSLAFHDPMVALGSLLSPLQWALGKPVLTLNLGTLLAIALSGYGAYRLATEVSGSAWGAGVVGGSVFAFNSYRVDHLAHMQLQSTGFIPLLYLCLRKFLESGSLRHAFGVAAFLWLTSSSSAYYGLFTWILFAVAIPYELWRTASWRNPRRILGLSLALSISGLAYLPLARPLMRLGTDFGLNRPLETVDRASARPADYLRSHSHVHRSLGFLPPSPERTLFPGVAALGLALLALLRPNRTSGLFVVMGFTALWTSLGPSWGLYRLLAAAVPGVTGIRVPPRMAIYVLMAVAMLAAQGAAALVRRLPASVRPGFFVLLALAPLVESFAGPIPYTRAPPIPPVYKWLAQLPEKTPLVELPFPEVKRQRENAVYLYWSTAHFQPLANGYGTVVPPVYSEIASALGAFPHEPARRTLLDLGLRHVVFHRDRYLRSRSRELERRLDSEPGLSAVHRTEEAIVYELVSPPAKLGR